MLLEADSVELIDFGEYGGDASLTGLDAHPLSMTDSNSGTDPSSNCVVFLLHCTLGEPTGVTETSFRKSVNLCRVTL